MEEQKNQKIGIIGQGKIRSSFAINGADRFPTESKTVQQKSTNPTSVETAKSAKIKKNEENIARRKMNQENRYKSRRGFIVKGSGVNGGFRHNAVQIGRNEPCHCGSGIKFKKCHLEKQRIVTIP